MRHCVVSRKFVHPSRFARFEARDRAAGAPARAFRRDRFALDASTARTLMSVADCSHDGKLCIEEFSDMIHAYLNLESLAHDACAATYQEIAAFLNGD